MKPLLGEILLERKLISKNQLASALSIQKKQGGLLGIILIELGYLEERNLVDALVLQSKKINND